MRIDLYKLTRGDRRPHRLRLARRTISVKSPSKRQLLVMKERVLTEDYLANQARLFQATGVRDGAAILDIGANIGYYSLMYATLLPTSQVIALEPSPTNFGYLVYNCKEFPRIHLFNVGAHDSAQEALLSMPTTAQYPRVSTMPANTGLLSIYGKAARLQEPVQLCPLDEFLTANAVSGLVGFAKVDVEGDEYHVLQGARRLLARDAPVLEVEINPEMLRQAGTCYGDIRNLLRSFGYEAFLFSDGQLQPFQGEIVEGVIDILFVRP